MHVDYIVNRVLNSRTYILSDDSDKVWLVDCGDVDKVLGKIGEEEIVGVLLSHAHFDHIYGLPGLLKDFPECLIYTNEWGKKALANDRLNMSRYHEAPVMVEGDNVKCLQEGDMLDILGKCCKVYETPGHNPSCLTFEIDGYMFTGDAYIPNTPVVTNLPNCNKTMAEKSLNRILNIVEDRTICPGHSV